MKKQFTILMVSVLMLVSSVQVMAATQYTITDLGTLGGGISGATGINNNGQIVGYSRTENWNDHAFLYDGTTMKDIGTLGGSESYAYGINNSGQVAGSSSINEGSAHVQHAFLYDGFTMKDIGTLGQSSSKASGINNSGQVVGYIYDYFGADPTHAFLYDGTEMRDLATLGGRASMAYGINDNGQIAGTGNINGQNHAFLMTPTPEPATLLLLGLGGLVLRRKQKK